MVRAVATWLVAATMIAAPSVAATSGVERTAILDAARKPVVARLGKPVKFKVQNLRHDGIWAFLTAELQDASGHPLSYKGTPLAEAEAEGVVSKDYAALLRRDHGRWRVVDQAIGPTDVAWEDWSQKHSAPAALFR